MKHVHEQEKRKANFFLVGAAKSGTTSVDSLLRSHSDVYLSPIKEPCYFCDDIRGQIFKEYRRQVPVLDFNTYFSGKDREIMHMYLVESDVIYSKLFEGACKKVIGECSTFYLPSKVAANNIYQYNSSAKIVAILRDPLKRICSHYEMDRRIGITDKPLMQLVTEELSLGKGANYGNSRFYIGASRYGEQLQRYYDIFPNDQIYVIFFEDLIAESDTEVRKLFDFLGLDVSDQVMTLPRENNARSVRFENINQLLYRAGIKPFINKWLPTVLPDTIKSLIKSIYFHENKVQLVTQDEIDDLSLVLENEGVIDDWRVQVKRKL